MKIGRVFLSVMLHQAKESEEKIILGCISAGCPGDNLDNKSDFGLESGPLDYRISSRTKSCAGDSDLQENVFFSGKLSGLIFFFFPSHQRPERRLLSCGCFTENKLWASWPEPSSPSFFPKEDPACWVKRERKVKGKEVKEKASFGDSLPVSPALKGKVDLERRMCGGGKSKLCHSEWIHQDPCWMWSLDV